MCGTGRCGPVVVVRWPRSIFLGVVWLIFGSGRRREVRTSLLCLCHVSRLAVRGVQISTTPVVSPTTQTSTRSTSSTFCTSSLFLSLLSFTLVVGIFVDAIVRVVALRPTILSRASLAASLLALVSRLVLVAALAIFTPVLDVFLLVWCEEATWYLFKELVGNLLCAVAQSLECEDRHLSMWRTPESGWVDRRGDVGLGER